jgi:hypothetical protein
MRGFFERREREGFAKGAKKYRNEFKKYNQLLADRFSNHLLKVFLSPLFFILFLPSALSAQPSRPLRSKIPRI